MSRKTIQFQMPKKSAGETSPPVPENIPALDKTSVDRWVHRQETIDEAVASSVTITIPGTPNWFEAAKIGFFLPTLTVWVWTLNAAERNLRFFTR